MHILNAAAMREADRRTIEEVGVSGRMLMENAGRAVVGVMQERIVNLDALSVAVVCGKGNNGGDGLVVLRTLAGLGCEARALVLAPFESLSTDSMSNLQAALKLDLPVDSVDTEEAWAGAFEVLGGADVIVDAILGTGLSEAAHGLYKKAIEDLNQLDAVKVAIDLPSGLSSDSGRVPGAALKADFTVALAAPKPCHFVPPACGHCGDVEVVDIGIPPVLLRGGTPGLETVEGADLLPLLPPRRREAHKGDYGHLVIVAGSVGKTGAALLAAEAALRTGCGLVTVASAQSAIPMMAPRLPEAMWAPMPETETGGLGFEACAPLESLLENRSALALGPGLGLHPDTVRLVQKLVSRTRIPAVVDADGLNALRKKALDHPLALTPHPGEAARLLGCSSEVVQGDRVQAVRQLATSFRAHVLLKGYRTLVSDTSGNVKINLTGNAGMATAGTGDVLTGIVGALLARGVSTDEALVLGAHVHGLAGDIAASEIGETSLMATDLIRKLPLALRELGAV